jgi:dephospho-CoA kinase
MIICLIGGKGSGRHTLADALKKQGYKDIRLTTPEEAGKLKEDIEGDNIIIVYLQCSRQNRFIRLMKEENNPEKCSNILWGDDKTFDIVKCDFVIDANVMFPSVLKRARKVLETIKEGVYY